MSPDLDRETKEHLGRVADGLDYGQTHGRRGFGLFGHCAGAWIDATRPIFSNTNAWEALDAYCYAKWGCDLVQANDGGKLTAQHVREAAGLTGQDAPEEVMPQTPTHEPTHEPYEKPAEKPHRPGHQRPGAAPCQGKPRRPLTTKQHPLTTKRPTRQRPWNRPASGGEPAPSRPTAKTPRREGLEWFAALALALSAGAAAVRLVTLVTAHLAFLLTVLGTLTGCATAVAVTALVDRSKARTRVHKGSGTPPRAPVQPEVEPAPVDTAWQRRWLGHGVKQQEKQL